MTLAFAPERIESWPLARLQPYAKNAKLHGPDQVAKLAATVAAMAERNGCITEILLWMTQAGSFHRSDQKHILMKSR
jgi:hypothetical protein